jgi:hypothetical protein
MLTDTLTDNATATATDTTDTSTDTATDTTATKRVIPRSDNKIVRLDVRFPKSMHDDIEALAIAKGEPIHHISNRPTLTPTILELIQIGLDHYSPEALERIQAKIESDKISKVLTDNCNDLEILEAKLTADILLKIASQQQQPPAIDLNIVARLEAVEAALAGK